MNIKGSKNNVVCEGSLIFDNADAVKVGLLKKLKTISKGSSVQLELVGVDEIDSSGLQLLLSFFKTLEVRGIPYKVVSISDEILEILNLSGLSKYFRLEV